jgi:uncharacterized protein (TIGR03067 family)
MTAALLSVLLLAPATDPPKLSDAAEKELKALAGKWKVDAAVTADGDDSPKEEMVLEFKGRKMLIAEKEVAEVTALDPEADPKCLDFKITSRLGPVLEPGTTYESIVKRDGDTLTWALYVGAGKKRPANFDRPTEAGFVVVTLKRVKE